MQLPYLDPQADLIAKLQKELEEERNAHQETKSKLETVKVLKADLAEDQVGCLNAQVDTLRTALVSNKLTAKTEIASLKEKFEFEKVEMTRAHQAELELRNAEHAAQTQDHEADKTILTELLRLSIQQKLMVDGQLEQMRQEA